MLAAAFTGLGSPDKVNVIEIDDPEIGPDQVLVSVKASTVNRHDIEFLERGRYLSEHNLPFVSGVDVAGIVQEVGAEVSRVERGDRVLLSPMESCGSCLACREGPENLCENFRLFHGGFAELASVDADRLIQIPDAISFRKAATLPVAYVTSWHMIHKANVRPGDTVLVPGGTGGVGIASIQLTQTLGATAIGTSRSASKLDKLNAKTQCNTVNVETPAELPERVQSAFGPVDVVINHLAGDYTTAGLESLKPGGRMVMCGRTAGDHSAFDPHDLFINHKEIIGSTMGTQSDLDRLVDLLADQQFDPPIFETYSLTEVAEAFRTMKNSSVIGKLVITPA